MSINTNVEALKLFGRDPSTISFAERISSLDEMLEKLFVLQQDGRFHMKVEHQSAPISEIMEMKKEAKENDEIQKLFVDCSVSVGHQLLIRS